MITQIVRLIDVFYVGALLIFVGSKFEMPMVIRIQLIIIGIATILYNGFRFLNQQKRWIEKNQNPDTIIHLPELYVERSKLENYLNDNYNLKLT